MLINVRHLLPLLLVCSFSGAAFAAAAINMTADKTQSIAGNATLFSGHVVLDVHNAKFNITSDSIKREGQASTYKGHVEIAVNGMLVKADSATQTKDNKILMDEATVSRR